MVEALSFVYEDREDQSTNARPFPSAYWQLVARGVRTSAPVSLTTFVGTSLASE